MTTRTTSVQEMLAEATKNDHFWLALAICATKIEVRSSSFTGAVQHGNFSFSNLADALRFAEQSINGLHRAIPIPDDRPVLEQEMEISDVGELVWSAGCTGLDVRFYFRIAS